MTTLLILITLAILLLAFVAYQQHRLMQKIGAAYTDPVAEWRRKARVRGRHYK